MLRKKVVCVMGEQQGWAWWWLWLWPILGEDVLYEDVAQGLVINGRSATQGAITALLFTSFDGVCTELQSVQAATDLISVQLVFNGRHCGHFAGIPATDRQVVLVLGLRLGLRNGRINHIQLDYDAGDLLYQLGLAYKETE